MSPQNGSDNVRCARNGIHLSRNRLPRRKSAGRTDQCGRSRKDGGPGPHLGDFFGGAGQDAYGLWKLDRVLGSGIVKGSLVLVGGDPGIGKSTLLLQVCRNLAGAGKRVLYISGEESLKQIKMRANRIGRFREIFCFMRDKSRHDPQRDRARKAGCGDHRLDQTMFREDISSAPGSVSQVRESTNLLMQIAKGYGITIFIVGHVTIEGVVAGPRVLEHMVDTVLYFEGDRNDAYRVLRAVKTVSGPRTRSVCLRWKKRTFRGAKSVGDADLRASKEASGAVVACSLEERDRSSWRSGARDSDEFRNGKTDGERRRLQPDQHFTRDPGKAMRVCDEPV